MAWGDNSAGECDVPDPNAGFTSIEAGRWHSLGVNSDVSAGVASAGMPGFNAFAMRPNPFAARTSITLELPRKTALKVSIYDAQGRLVWTDCRGTMARGHQEITWDGRDGDGRELPAGAYLTRITTADGTTMGKVILAR